MSAKRTYLILGGTGAVALALAGARLLPGEQTSVDPTHLSAGSTPAAPHVSPPWSNAQLQDLLTAVRAADKEGLRPSDYKLAALEAAVTGQGSSADNDAAANAAAIALAHDYSAGRVKNRHRFNWYIDYAGPSAAAMTDQIVAARSQGRLGSWFAGLLPTSASYQALRTALATAPAEDQDRRDRIIANMERWRWLPRDFGKGDQLYVNLPSYQLDVMTDGRVTQSFKAVIGATDMPTPVLSAPVRQVIANPDWIVPASIVRKSHLRPGGKYIFSTRPDGTVRVRQKPGPGNALGRVKIEFPNPMAIYFHDTPSKSLFGASDRTFSHGCVRVQNIEALAESIVAQPDRFGDALTGSNTRGFKTARPWRATIVYLTMVAGPDETLRFVGDPYHMDDMLAAAVQGRKPQKPTVPPPALPSKTPAVKATTPKPSPTPSTTDTAPLPPSNASDQGNVSEAAPGNEG